MNIKWAKFNSKLRKKKILHEYLKDLLICRREIVVRWLDRIEVCLFQFIPRSNIEHFHSRFLDQVGSDT